MSTLFYLVLSKLLKALSWVARLAQGAHSASYKSYQPQQAQYTLHALPSVQLPTLACSLHYSQHTHNSLIKHSEHCWISYYTIAYYYLIISRNNLLNYKPVWHNKRWVHNKGKVLRPAQCSMQPSWGSLEIRDKEIREGRQPCHHSLPSEII